MLHQIIYTSHSLVRMTGAELAQLLEHSRRNNEALGITGLLLHADGSFMQTIEGEHEAIQRLLAKIRRDPRHTSLIVIADDLIESRSFGDWSMAFREVTRDEASAIPGFYQKQADLTADDRNLARNLMQTFFKNAQLNEDR